MVSFDLCRSSNLLVRFISQRGSRTSGITKHRAEKIQQQLTDLKRGLSSGTDERVSRPLSRVLQWPSAWFGGDLRAGDESPLQAS